MWTDEVHFTLTGNVNSINSVHWVDNNPHDVFVISVHDEKVTLWCGKRSIFILGPCFFAEVTNRNLESVQKRVLAI